MLRISFIFVALPLFAQTITPGSSLGPRCLSPAAIYDVRSLERLVVPRGGVIPDTFTTLDTMEHVYFDFFSRARRSDVSRITGPVPPTAAVPNPDPGLRRQMDVQLRRYQLYQLNRAYEYDVQTNICRSIPLTGRMTQVCPVRPPTAFHGRPASEFIGHPLTSADVPAGVLVETRTLEFNTNASLPESHIYRVSTAGLALAPADLIIMKPDHPNGKTRLFRYEFFTNYQSFFAPLSADIFTLPAACSNL